MTDTTHAHTAAKDADRIREALASGPVTVPTGAGISTDSGVPDHRGPDSPPRSPMTYQEFVGTPPFAAATGRATTSGGGTWSGPGPTTATWPVAR